MHTEQILDRLLDLEESPWGSAPGGRHFDGRRMSQLLNDFGVKPKSIRIGGVVKRGY